MMKKAGALKKGGLLLFYLAAFWFLLGYIVVPMGQTLLTSIRTKEGWSLSGYLHFLSGSSGWAVLRNTLLMGLLTVLICGLIGTALAFLLAFAKLPCRRLIHILLLSPMMVPGIIIVISFLQLYGESGIVTKAIQLMLNLPQAPFRLSGLGGILFVHAYTQYVYFYLNVSSSLRYVDASALEAARGMGASPFRILTTILLPAVRPALFSSAVVTFISGISSFSAPNLLGGRYKVLSTQIMLAKANNNMDIASMEVVFLLIMGLLALLGTRILERKYRLEAGVRNVPIRPKAISSPLVRTGCFLLLGILLTLIILPVAAIFVLSFVRSSSLMMDIFPREFHLDNYVRLFSKARVFQPFANSIRMSLATVAAGLLFSLPLSYLAAKKRTPVNAAAELLATLPWAMPASTIAVNLINSFNVPNVFSFGTVLIGTQWILPLGYFIAALPLLMRSNLLALEGFSTTLEHASRGLGAGPVSTFLRVTAPAIFPSILSGGALIFIRTVGEYTMSALLYGVSNRPASIAMVTAMQEYEIGLSMAYGVLLILVCFAAMLFAMVLDRKKYQF